MPHNQKMSFHIKKRNSRQIVSNNNNHSTNIPSIREPPIPNNEQENEPQELRRSKSARIEKNLGEEFFTFMIEDEPNTYKDAISFVDAPFWKEPINSEFNSIFRIILRR